MGPKLLLDLDNSLIDSQKRLHDEIAACAQFGVSEETYWKAVHMVLEHCSMSYFGYDALFAACRIIQPGISDDLLKAWYNVITIPRLFDDSYPFLGSFPKEQLGLLTTGSQKFQKMKIKANDLERFFSQIWIVPSPKANHVSPKPGSVYVDDSPREIDAMKKLHPHVYCILVRTPAPWETQKKSALADIELPDLASCRDHIFKLGFI